MKEMVKVEGRLGNKRLRRCIPKGLNRSSDVIYENVIHHPLKVWGRGDYLEKSLREKVNRDANCLQEQRGIKQPTILPSWLVQRC